VCSHTGDVLVGWLGEAVLTVGAHDIWNHKRHLPQPIPAWKVTRIWFPAKRSPFSTVGPPNCSSGDCRGLMLAEREADHCCPLNAEVKNVCSCTSAWYVCLEDEVFGHRDQLYLTPPITLCKARDSIVLKALCYKPEDRGFETRWGELIFPIYPILPAALGPGVHSASKRNVSGE
jgi:hypothetical protein